MTEYGYPEVAIILQNRINFNGKHEVKKIEISI